MLKPRLDLRKGVTDPLIVVISRQSVEECDVDRVCRTMRPLMVSKEDVITYCQQVCVVFEGWDSDPRELIDVQEFRLFVQRLAVAWPEWPYFLNQVDTGIGLWISCLAGNKFPGGGAVEIDMKLLKTVMIDSLHGMNSVYDRFGLSESNLEKQSTGFISLIQNMSPD